jgi:hypothetical protein
MTGVSVVIPLFGTHRGLETISTVADSWLDQDLSCEVVVATDTGIPLDTAVTEHGSKRVRVVATTISPTRGRLSNVAVAGCRSEWLYLTDADVIPLGRDYLRRALAAATAADGFLAQPRMLRLTGPSPGGLPSRWQLAPGNEQVCFVRRGAKGDLVRDPGESVFVWAEFDGQLWADPPPDLVSSSPGEFQRRPALHWGAALVRRETFLDVGGFCTRYEGWGCEDEDLLEKLTARLAMLTGWRSLPELLCLHFEHPRAKATQGYAANQALLERRRRAGGEAMIGEDLALSPHRRRG